MLKIMKAIVYTNPHEMSYLDQPSQPLSENEVRVQIEAAGICGSDMHAYHGHDQRRQPPLILGHEAAGYIMEGLNSGQRVALNPLITCEKCAYCFAGRSNLCENRTMIGMTRPGAMAQEVTIPYDFVLPIPDKLSSVAASLMEPTGCAWHAVELVESVQKRPFSQSRILIIGAGAIGILLALISKHKGSQEIILMDTNPLRRKTATQIQVGEAVDPRKNHFLNQFDIVFDAVGSELTRKTAVEAIKPGGVILHIGLQEPGGEFDARKITLDEIVFLGSYTYTKNDLQNSLDALHLGHLGDLSWVEERPLSEGAQAFADLDSGRTAAAKIVLIP